MRNTVYHVAPSQDTHLELACFLSLPPCCSVRGDFQMFIIKHYEFSKVAFFLVVSFCGNKINLCSLTRAPMSLTTLRGWSNMLLLWIKHTNSSL